MTFHWSSWYDVLFGLVIGACIQFAFARSRKKTWLKYNGNWSQIEVIVAKKRPEGASKISGRSEKAISFGPFQYEMPIGINTEGSMDQRTIPVRFALTFDATLRHGDTLDLSEGDLKLLSDKEPVVDHFGSAVINCMISGWNRSPILPGVKSMTRQGETFAINDPTRKVAMYTQRELVKRGLNAQNVLVMISSEELAKLVATRS